MENDEKIVSSSNVEEFFSKKKKLEEEITIEYYSFIKKELKEKQILQSFKNKLINYLDGKIENDEMGSSTAVRALELIEKSENDKSNNLLGLFKQSNFVVDNSTNISDKQFPPSKKISNKQHQDISNVLQIIDVIKTIHDDKEEK